YDLLIIGGGITGAGIALDATLRGLSVLLVEKIDFASGTSSKSTKLIHGGLRYLKQLELGLVKETGLERAVAHHNIPHLVHPEKMLLPIVKSGTFSKFSASIAISIYDRLAKVPKEDRKVNYNKAETLKQEKLLNPDLLKSGVQYSEYRTDDARLTIELIKAARRAGAEAFNYIKVTDFIYEHGQVRGVKCKDLSDDSSIGFLAKQVVSAAGPWVDKLREINQSKKGKTLQLTKGVHIVMPSEKLPLKHSVYFDAFDGRMLFAIPRGKITYVGTSDTNYTGDKDKVLCTTADAEYILNATNAMFEVGKLKKDDIISTWAGLRPLIHEDGKSPSELSRKDEIFVSKTNLISIAGGKLTGFRKMAERIVDLVQEKHDDVAQGSCLTKTYKIHADSFENYKAFQSYKNQIISEYGDRGISAYDAWYYSTTYGKHARTIIDEALQSSFAIEKALIQKEIEYCIQYESCYMPEDYFNRRTGRIYFDIESVRDNFDFIISEFNAHFNWESSKLESIKLQSMKSIEDVTIIKS
ncbi:UNVERIFIED_CONTAM: hypothetical protein GTU68_061392, partial [Idotea baltica]|nr:hypothetical protein [Idotea baltica]